MKEIIDNTNKKVKSTISVLCDNLSKIIATGSHPSLLNGIRVECYETLTPLNQIANISSRDAITLIVTPFDKAIVKEIVIAINKANLGLNPVDEGSLIKIGIPPLTTEKRETFVKEAKLLGENARISIRNIRQDSNKKIKSKDLSENEKMKSEEDVQKIINESNKEVEKIIKSKMDDLLKI